MTQVLVEGKEVAPKVDNKDNDPSLPGYDPKKDPNSAAYEEKNPNPQSENYIHGLLPSTPLGVDDPTSPHYQNPAKSDFMHASPSEVYVNPDGGLHLIQSDVKVVKEERTLNVTEVPKDATLLSAGNPVKVEVVKETKKETEVKPDPLKK